MVVTVIFGDGLCFYLRQLMVQVTILLANVLQQILHKVLSMTKVKIFRYCSTINFSKDYFRQQYPYLGMTPYKLYQKSP